VVPASDWWPLVEKCHPVHLLYVTFVLLRFHCIQDHLIRVVNNCVASVALEELCTPWMNSHLAGLTEPLRSWNFSNCVRLNITLLLHAVIPVCFLFSPLSPLSPSFGSSNLLFCFALGFTLRFLSHPPLCLQYPHLPGRLTLVACGWREHGLPVDRS
jgi:hypothetical protein